MGLVLQDGDGNLIYVAYQWFYLKFKSIAITLHVVSLQSAEISENLSILNLPNISFLASL